MARKKKDEPTETPETLKTNAEQTVGALVDAVTGQTGSVENVTTVPATEPETEIPMITEIAAHDASALAEIAKVRDEVKTALSRYLIKKEDASAAKKRYESLQEKLIQVIDEATEPKKATLFEPAKPGIVTPKSEPPTDDETWKAVGLNALGLPPSVVEALEGYGLVNIGDIVTYAAPNAAGYCKALTDIPKIGQGKAEKIEAALQQFWTERATVKPVEGESNSDDVDTELSDETGDEQE